MASERPKRTNAGNRMAELLDGKETEKDEFYEEAYGGFTETKEDTEYEWVSCDEFSREIFTIFSRKSA